MKEKLLKLGEKLETLSADLDELKSAAPRLIAQVESLTDELRGIDVKTFILPPSDVSPEDPTAMKLRALKDLGAKLELLPSVRRRCEEEIAQIRAQISQQIRSAFGTCFNSAKQQLSELKSQLIEQFTPVCGGDTIRARRAAEAVCSESELVKWKNCFDVVAAQFDNASQLNTVGIRNALALIQRFEKGAPRN